MSYLALAGLFLAPSVALAVLATWKRRLGGSWWKATTMTIGILVALTLVFDNLMIAADLFRYDAARLSGWRIGLAPIEDLAWPVAAGLLLPAVAALARRESER